MYQSRFHNDALIFDIHIHGKDIFSSPIHFLRRSFPLKFFFHPLSSLSVLREGEVDGGILSAIGDRTFKHLNQLPGHTRQVYSQLNKFEQDIKECRGRIVLTSQVILQAKQDNLLSFVLGMEGAGPIEDDFEN